MKISGHRTRAMLDRYNITSDEDLQDAMLKVTEYVSTLPTDSLVVRLADRIGGRHENTDTNTDNGSRQPTQDLVTA